MQSLKTQKVAQVPPSLRLISNHQLFKVKKSMLRFQFFCLSLTESHHSSPMTKNLNTFEEHTVGEAHTALITGKIIAS